MAILCVEDEEDSFLILNKAIEKAGLSTSLRQVCCVNQAIEYLEGTGRYADRVAYPFPSLVLLDIKMSKRTGHELLQWIRGQKKFQGLVVIMLTASRDEQDVEQAYGLGANAYLVKPSVFAETVEMIKAIDLFWIRQNHFINQID